MVHKLSKHIPLQNRVLPTGEIVSLASRGTFMGNRGGRFHDPETRTLTSRRWASRRWICCVTSFKNRQRKVMGQSYTELFFLDEPTALAAGHRPCFECRRADANAFADAFAKGQGADGNLAADPMDLILHADRLDGRHQRTFEAPVNDLPDGAMVMVGSTPHAVLDRRLIIWTPEGYQVRQGPLPSSPVSVLTPQCICHTLANGYRPHWHASASRAVV